MRVLGDACTEGAAAPDVCTGCTLANRCGTWAVAGPGGTDEPGIAAVTVLAAAAVAVLVGAAVAVFADAVVAGAVAKAPASAWVMGVVTRFRGHPGRSGFLDADLRPN